MPPTHNCGTRDARLLRNDTEWIDRTSIDGSRLERRRDIIGDPIIHTNWNLFDFELRGSPDRKSIHRLYRDEHSTTVAFQARSNPNLVIVFLLVLFFGSVPLFSRQ